MENNFDSVLIETTRLILQKLSLTQNAAFFNYRSNVIVNQFQGWIPKNPDDSKRFIARNSSHFNEPESWFQLAIFNKQSNHLIGDIGIHFVDHHHCQCEIGFTINSSYHRQGFAFEAVQAVIDLLFNQLNKHRITASIDPRNSASIALVQKLGFRKEAHHIKSYLQNGEWLDNLVFALLKEEWTSN